MLQIIWLLLKTAGIILAALLALLLTGILLFLFVPVRYRIRADGRLGEEEPFRAQVKLTWLMHIVNAAFSFPEAAYLRVRIFVFTVFRSSSSSGNGEKDAGTDPEELQRDEEDREWDEMTVTGASDDEQTDPEEPPAGQESAVCGKGQRKDPEPPSSNVQEQKAQESRRNTERKGSLRDRIRRLADLIRRMIDRIKEAIGNIGYTIKAICDRIRKIASDIRYYTEVLQSDVFQAAFSLSKGQLARILRSVRPKKCDIWLRAGTGDPAGTGQILALYGILYPFIGNNVRVEADFGEEASVEGRLFISGRITLFTLLVAGIRVYRDKNIRRLMKMLKREEA